MRARLVQRHPQHHYADQLRPLGLGPGLGLAQQDDDNARAGRDLGDAVAPPGEQLLVVQRRQEGAGHAVVGDARPVQRGEVWD